MGLNKMLIGERIRDARIDMGLRQDQLAEMGEISEKF
jgi:transcriptional regulator with XRE-family HTH domain